jgi:electron transfer flavoprotein-quinone oxidoreductase
MALSNLYADGVLVVGDAAGFCFSNGIVIQGMNYAVRSGIAAADAVVTAIAKNDFSAMTLAAYEKNLEKDGTLDDFRNFRNVSKFLWNPRLFQKYPDMLAEVFRSMLKAEGPKQKMRHHLKAAMKKAGVKKTDILADAINGGMNL